MAQHRVRRLSLSLSLALSFAVAVAAGASAIASPWSDNRADAACSPTPPRSPMALNWQAIGWNTGFSGAVGGIYGVIEKKDPYVYGSSPVETVDWVMLWNPGQHWAQIGFTYTTAGTKVFAQVTDPNSPLGFVTKYNTASSTGVYPYFTVLYGNQPGKFTFQLNSQDWKAEGESNPYNPTAYFVPHNVASGGEIHNRADQMPGGTQDTAAHLDMHLWYAGVWQDGWLTTTYRFGASSSEFGLDPPSGSVGYSNGKHFYIWDKKCST